MHDGAPGSVGVWLGWLEPPAATLARLRALLDADELARAARFVFERDRRRFVAAHGFARLVLGGYLGLDGARLRFGYGPHGKPFVVDAPEVRFSLSHADELAAVAVAHGCEVGVDVERIQPEVASPELARRFFAAAEIAALERYAGAEYARAFFACWTRKEAFVKALGLGLALPLDSFAVSVDPEQPPALASAGTETAGWRLHTFQPAPGWAGALAVEHAAQRPTIHPCTDLAELLPPAHL